MSDITSQVQPTHPPHEGATDVTDRVSPRAPAHDGDDLTASDFAVRQRPGLRLWPGLVLVALQWAAIGFTFLALAGRTPSWLVLPPMLPFFTLFLGPTVIAVGLVVWWLFFSRLRWSERPLILLAIAAMGVGAFFTYHESFDVMVVMMITLRTVTTVWVGSLLVTMFFSWPIRRAVLLASVLLAWGYYGLLRFEGVYGDMKPTLSWRWSKTSEDVHREDLARRTAAPRPTEDEVLTLGPGDWPAFRGANRDGKVTGVRLATDWAKHPPKELWKQTIGFGWGSFTVIGDRLYTQEQLDNDEIVNCYRVSDGKIVWTHKDQARFTEKVAGPGPRATPTFYEGKIYALGATGKLNCLLATTGRPLWQRDLVEDSGAKVPMWGFSSSPLVMDGIVSVFAGGPNGKSVVAYDAETGKPAWQAGEGLLSYCSPHPAKVGGVEQIMICTDAGLTALHPKTGAVLWQHGWPIKDQARVIQPTILDDTDVLLGTGMSMGTRRLHLKHDGDTWKQDEVWTTKAIKPYYNDLVVYGKHLYGFDSGLFTCVALEDGKATWRERGYGNGQVLLLADQGLLLIVTESGDVVLAEAKPEELKELGRFTAFEGKTWNHPVVANGKLFVRNGEYMACYELTLEK